MRYILILLILLTTACSNNVAQTIYMPNEKATDKAGERKHRLLHMPKMKYPRFLWNRGIEGFAVVEFDIDEKGLTQNHRVIESERGEVLSEPAIDHVRKFKYSPKMVDGVAVMAEGVRLRISFCYPSRRHEEGFVFENRSENCNRLHPEE
ncbi:energy transducer TonB [uncultured Pseudoteredinibacter sp.]|uniref:energy transducer TonB n=1 Tax=uncultured Pseudoteredinibacter sp. TaxID=1641701 RepID=UPI00261317CD|nr:energy transducer TonB [uncultured Pseudoteredinibacter sp.]